MMRQQDPRQTSMQILQRLVSSYWPAISRTDVAWIRGSRERLLHVVVRTYGLDRETAERQIRAFLDLVQLPVVERPAADAVVASPHFPAQMAEAGLPVQTHQALPASASDAAVVDLSRQEAQQHSPAKDSRVQE